MPCGEGTVVNRTLTFSEDVFTHAPSLLTALEGMGFLREHMRIEGGALVASVDSNLFRYAHSNRSGVTLPVRFVKTANGLMPEIREDILRALDQLSEDNFLAALNRGYNGAIIAEFAAATGGQVNAKAEGNVLRVEVTY